MALKIRDAYQGEGGLYRDLSTEDGVYVGLLFPTDDPAADARRARLFAMVEEMAAEIRDHAESLHVECGRCMRLLARLDADGEGGA